MGNDPLILEIKGNSLDDGPGIRTVVFLKGCPLSCAWCHNPESKRAGAELSFDAGECAVCDACIEACGTAALDRGRDDFVNRERCDLCFGCVEVCPSGALSRVGREMDVDEVVSVCLQDMPFFKTSGGGVTLSGGEPTLFMDYCSRLLAALKAEHIHTIVETCGFFDIEDFERLVLPYSDAVYYDIKILEPARHKELCGVSNERILSNLSALASRARSGDFELLARIPLVPGMTATTENLRAGADFLKKAGLDRVDLLSYNPFWLAKSRKIGMPDALERDGTMIGFMKHSEILTLRGLFEGFEIIE